MELAQVGKLDRVAMDKILIIEAEAAIADNVVYPLKTDGFETDALGCAVRLPDGAQPDLELDRREGDHP